MLIFTRDRYIINIFGKLKGMGEIKMLQIKEISKKYITGDFEQTALNGVSLNLRDNEFVAILGPSGSGKTTLLNIIGGLDRYDSGDLIINGISTKKYKDRDWDSYRNHTIGFVFQSYNLIPHQSILSNVELALTISGVGRSERRNRAKQALIEVGLGDHIHKRPNQLSGGQMQRVAIARALVNNPSILLADEPTGALDTDTSVQVMELLKNVAKDRLVVMVTHNPELAETYATRIVKVRDGNILEDSDPYIVESETEAVHKNMGKSSMSLGTALSLSANNLRTKKGRTLLTAFAGSIGIIGIALILSMSNGVNTYINDIQKQTMTAYPISIEETTFDFSSIIEDSPMNQRDKEVDHELNAIYPNNTEFELASSMTTSMTENNLTEFKKYIENDSNNIKNYIGSNGIVYSYNTKFDVFTFDPEDYLINTNGSTLNMKNQAFSSFGEIYGLNSSILGELLPSPDGLVSEAYKSEYDMLYGKWPESYNEIVLILDENNELTATEMYELGLFPVSEYRKLREQLSNGEELDLNESKIEYEEICNKPYYLIPTCDMYIQNDSGTYDYIGDNNTKIEESIDNALELHVVGIIRHTESEFSAMSRTLPLGYTKLLTDYIIEYTNNSEIVQDQISDDSKSVLTGLTFNPSGSEDKVENAKTYLMSLNLSEKADLARQLFEYIGSMNDTMLSMMMGQYDDFTEQFNDIVRPSTNMSQFEGMTEEELAALAEQYGMNEETPSIDISELDPSNFTEQQLAEFMDKFLEDPDETVLLSIYDMYVTSGTYEDTLDTLGYVNLDSPSAINIYVDSFEAKQSISDCIDEYNKTADEQNQITYVDYIGILLSSVTTIIDVISYVLIAFVAVSLIVSSIMIGIITYISVLERTKEIGILRAIGASKRNVSQVFNAETFIIGLMSGLIGVGVTVLLNLPISAVVHALTKINTINSTLPMLGGVILVILSTILTLIGGIIPSKAAAKKDPVTALRIE